MESVVTVAVLAMVENPDYKRLLQGFRFHEPLGQHGLSMHISTIICPLREDLAYMWS